MYKIIYRPARYGSHHIRVSRDYKLQKGELLIEEGIRRHESAHNLVLQFNEMDYICRRARSLRFREVKA